MSHYCRRYHDWHHYTGRLEEKTWMKDQSWAHGKLPGMARPGPLWKNYFNFPTFSFSQDNVVNWIFPSSTTLCERFRLHVLDLLVIKMFFSLHIYFYHKCWLFVYELVLWSTVFIEHEQHKQHCHKETVAMCCGQRVSANTCTIDQMQKIYWNTE